MPEAYNSLPALEEKLGHKLDIFLWYQSLAEDFDVGLADWLWQRGTKIQLAWEPHNPSKSPGNQPEYRLTAITRGDHDPEIRQWAQQIKDFGHPVYFRPMCEMNSDYVAWGAYTNGNQPEEYIPAWRHVREIFREVGADNALFIWSPNRAGDETSAEEIFDLFYPGDAYVDYVGIDGYNWGLMYDTPEWTSRWQSFNEVFGPSYNVAARRTNKPIFISETASTELGGSKAAWIENAFTQIEASYPRIEALVWFNYNKETDWRIDNNDINLEAFRDYAFRAPLDTIPPSTQISTTPSIPSGDNDWFAEAATVTLTRSEPGATYHRWDGEADYENTDIFRAPEGKNVLHYYSVDTAGNRETPDKTATIMVDTFAPSDPEISSISATGTPLASNIVTIQLANATDGASGVSGYSGLWDKSPLALPNASQNMDASVDSTTSPPLSAGDNWFHLRTKDNAGNWTSTVHIGPFVVDGIDGTPPSNPTAATELGGAQTGISQSTVSDPNFTWAGASDGSGSGVKGYYYYWGTSSSGNPTNWTTSASYDPSAVSTPTTYYLRVKTEDNSGNQSSPATIFTFKYDADAPSDPSITGSNPIAGTWTNDNTVKVNFSGASDAASGVDGYSVSWSKGATDLPDTTKDLEETANSATSAVLADGNQYFHLRTVDSAGNWTSTVHYGPFKIDTTDPTGSMKINGSATYTKTTNVTLNLSGSDTGSGLDKMRFMNAGGSWSSWQNYSTTKSWTLTSSQGIKRVYFQVKDGAGNVSSIASDTIKLDTKNPVTRMVAPFVSTRISKTTTFKVKWSATDASPSSGIDSYTVRYRRSGSSTWRIWKSNTTATEALFTGKAGVTYYFRTVAYDKAGNRDWSKTYKTIVPFNEGIFLSKIGFFGYQKLGKSQNYLTSVRYSYKRGHTLKYKLYKNNGIGLIVTKGPNMGRAKIYVDGKYVTTVDAYSSKKRPRQLIYYRNFSKKGTHYLKVVNLGTPGRAHFEVDAVVVKR